MKTIFSIILYFLLLHFTSFSQAPPTDPHWVLQWDDEFWNPSPSSGLPRPTTWNIVDGLNDLIVSTPAIGNWTIGNWVIGDDWDHGGDVEAAKKDNAYIVPGTGLVLTVIKESSNYDCWGCTNGGVFLSTDVGADWSAANNVESTSLTRSEINSLTSQYVFSLAYDGTNLLAGTDGGVFKSADEGATWLAVNSGLSAPADPANLFVHSLYISSTGDWYAGTENGLFFYNTSTITWDSKNLLGNTIMSFFKISTSNWVAGTTNGVYYSSSSGATWFQVTATIGISVNSFAEIGSNLFAGTNNGVYISATSSSGASWAAVNGSGATALTNLSVNALAFDGSNLFAGTNDGVFLSSDNGATWAAKGLTSVSVLSLLITGTDIYAGTQGEGVYTSSLTSLPTVSWTAVNGSVSYPLSNKTVNAIATDGTDLFAGTPGTSFPIHHYSTGSVELHCGDNHPLPLYGYLEAYITHVPDNFGLHPAFWSYSDPTTYNCHETTNSHYEEMDEFEMIPGDRMTCMNAPFDGRVPDKYLMTDGLHLDGLSKCLGEFDAFSQLISINDYTQAHCYGLEWSPSKLIYYVDGKAVRNTTNPNPMTGNNVFQAANVELGIGVDGYVQYPDYIYTSTGYDNNNPDPVAVTNYYELPSYYTADLNSNPNSINDVNPEMHIQYVKFYTLAEDCDNPLTITSLAELNAYDNKSKEYIEINPSAAFSVDNDLIKCLRASGNSTNTVQGYILIDKDFTVPLGKKLYLDVNDCY